MYVIYDNKRLKKKKQTHSAVRKLWHYLPGPQSHWTEFDICASRNQYISVHKRSNEKPKSGCNQHLKWLSIS